MSAQCGDAGDGILRQASYAMNTNGVTAGNPAGMPFCAIRSMPLRNDTAIKRRNIQEWKKKRS